MRVLLDTHTLIWWVSDVGYLTGIARQVLEDAATVVHVSAASGWEIATKFRLGKLPSVAPIVDRLEDVIVEAGFRVLPVTMRHAVHAGRLPGVHRDPFDRMLMAQSLLEDMPVVGNDAVFDPYGVRRIW